MSQWQEGVELRATFSVAFKWDTSWRGSLQGRLTVGGIKSLDVTGSQIEDEGREQGYQCWEEWRVCSCRARKHSTFSLTTLTWSPCFFPLMGFFASPLSFPSASKLHPLKVLLASGTWVHTGNEMKQGKPGSNRSRLILLHNGDEQYLHNNILGC